MKISERLSKGETNQRLVGTSIAIREATGNARNAGFLDALSNLWLVTCAYTENERSCTLLCAPCPQQTIDPGAVLASSHTRKSNGPLSATKARQHGLRCTDKMPVARLESVLDGLMISQSRRVSLRLTARPGPPADTDDPSTPSQPTAATSPGADFHVPRPAERAQHDAAVSLATSSALLSLCARCTHRRRGWMRPC